MKVVAAIAILATVLSLGGCSEKQELSKEDKKTLESNLTRELTPEEASKLGGGSGGDSGGGPAAAPPEKG